MTNENLATIKCPLCYQPLTRKGKQKYLLECLNKKCPLIEVKVSISYYDEKLASLRQMRAKG